MELKKTFKHTGVLMMLGVLALGLLGAAYTLWYEDLTLATTVETGTFDVDWSCDEGIEDDPDLTNCENSAMAVVSLDEGENYQMADDLVNDIPNIEEKLPSCAAAISTDATGDQTGTGGTNNVLDLYVGNDNDPLTEDDIGAYPYAGCEFWINIHSEGTVPAHLTVISAENDADFDPLDIELSISDESDEGCDALIAAVFVTSVTDQPTEVEGVQLHEGDALVCHIRVTLAQQAEEGDSFTNTWTVRAHQWNEDADPTPAAP